MLPLDLAAHNVWDEYHQQLEQRDIRTRNKGHTVLDHRQHKQFYAAAEYCVSNQISERDYVRTVLDGLLKASIYLLPKDLNTSNARRIYAKAQEKYQGLTYIQRSWNHQVVTLRRARMSNPQMFRTDADVLYAYGSPYSSWFKTIYVTPIPEQLLQRYGVEAWSELNKAPDLRLFCQKERPENYQTLQEYRGYFGGVATGNTYE